MFVLGLILAALPAPDFTADYASVMRRVQAGESIVVYVGVSVASDAPPNAVSLPTFPGVEANRVLKCFPHNGKPSYEAYQATPKTTALPVAANTATAPTLHAAPPIVVRLSRTPGTCTGPNCPR